MIERFLTSRSVWALLQSVILFAIFWMGYVTLA